MSFACFVTGTDTDVGKTLVASALLEKCRERGWTAVGMKPVAAGCDSDGGNGYVRSLIAAGNLAVEHRLINPYLFRDPIAPHIAAAEAGVAIEPARILESFERLREKAEAVVVEGAGGLLVPLGPTWDGGDLARLLGLPVVLVVGMRLGCINHALLTQEAIAKRGLTLAGWVANRSSPAMDRYAENLEALRQRLAAPLLGEIPFLDPPDATVAAGCLELPDAAVGMRK